MADPIPLDRIYHIYFNPANGTAVDVRYQARGVQHEVGPGGVRRKVPPVYTARVEGGKDTAVRWEQAPTADARELAVYEEDARSRATALEHWLRRLAGLYAAVEPWLAEFDWSARVIQKQVEEPGLGHYAAPALLMQRELTRAILEPVAHRSPKTDGVVDFYILPAYDATASLYFYSGRWHVHYAKAPADVPDPDVVRKPLTKASFRRALAELEAYAR